MPGPRPSTLDRLGGPDAIAIAVTGLYERVWADPELGPYFHRTDRVLQRQRMRELLLLALGAEAQMSLEALRAAHAGRGITHRQFSILAGHLADTLDDLGFGAEEVDDVLALVASAREAVVEIPSLSPVPPVPPTSPPASPSSGDRHHHHPRSTS